MIQLSTVSGLAVAAPAAISLGKIIVISAVVVTIGATLYLGSQAMLNIASKVASLMQELFSSRARLSPYQQALSSGCVLPQPPRVVVVHQPTPLSRPLYVDPRQSASHDQPGVRGQPSAPTTPPRVEATGPNWWSQWSSPSGSQGTPAVPPPRLQASAITVVRRLDENTPAVPPGLRAMATALRSVNEGAPEVSSTGHDVPGARAVNRKS